jgi:mRNA interferase RelE/StbE
MGKFKIEFTRKASKNYKKLPKDYKSLIDLSLAKLSAGLSADIKPIIGQKDTYRIRVGKYRILFITIEDTLLIVKIAPRGEAYK